MSTTFDVLVIILSSLLGLFLILSVIVAIMVLKITSSIRRLVARGEQVIDSAEAATALFRKASGPLGLLRMVTSVVEAVTKHKK